MNCQEMLQPIFEHIRKTATEKQAIPGSRGRYQENQVFSTVTMHHAGDRTHGEKADFVLYGNGQLVLAREGNEDVLTGIIQAWINDVKIREVKESWIFDRTVVDRDVFPNTPQMGIQLTVRESGLVSLGITINGNPWKDLPPVTYQPSNCTEELLTSVIDEGFMGSHGPCSVTIGFTLTSNESLR